MLWELFQTSRIEQSNWNAADASRSAREAQGDVRQVDDKVRVLEQQCERLTLVAMAMAEILRDRLGLTEPEIETKIIEIDQRDGQLDGRFRPSAEPCPECQRPNGANRRNCLYCGAELTPDSFLFQSSEGTGENQNPSDQRTE
ncbi:MAG: hypothetical protein H7062_24260 [Candidatus Saccharimonas sp.]|nr:hypothetical protein [Planctomycetaceae bacterium]